MSAITRRRILFLTLAAVLAAPGLFLSGWSLWTWATWPDVAGLAARPPGSTAFIDGYRERASAGDTEARVRWTWVPDSDIDRDLHRAVVVAEDIEFFGHEGFSTAEIRAAIRQAVEERRAPRGASTITQQLAKNLWLSPSRNPLRKLKEALLTRSLERHLGKRRILEIYLNVVEFGPGVFGAEAAARNYFGHSAAVLSRTEAAQLAAGLPRPSSWHPGVTTSGYRARVVRIEGLMERARFLDRYLGPSDGLVAAPRLVADPEALDSLLAVELDSLLPLEKLDDSTAGGDSSVAPPGAIEPGGEEAAEGGPP